jgi:hypothetical protein
MNRQWVIAVAVVSAALAFAGAAEASTRTPSPQAPHRAAASPRRSAAGASATATHAVRSRHGRAHRRRHRIGAHSQLRVARVLGSTAGGLPPMPARHEPAPTHHAALRPVPHGARDSARSKSGSHGASAESLARVAVQTAMSRLGEGLSSLPISHEDRATWGRGPPRAGPQSNAFSSPPLGIPVSSTLRLFATQFQRHTTRSSRSPALWALSRDRLESRRPHANRLEGAVVCLDSPSIGDLS